MNKTQKSLMWVEIITDFHRNKSDLTYVLRLMIVYKFDDNNFPLYSQDPNEKAIATSGVF